jgi:branched-subunit amino acid transport protein
MAAVDSPFAILTAVVAPAILTNACSILSLGTANRVARVVDRTRVVSRSLKDLDINHAGRALYVRQLERLDARGQLLVRALRFFYFALGAFAASALLAVLGSILASWDLGGWFNAAAILAVVTGCSAVVGLVAGCALMVRETRLAIDNMSESAKLHAEGSDFVL